MNGKWKGTALFLAIFVVMGATFGLRLYMGSQHSAVTTSLSSAPVTPVPSGTPTTAAGPASTSGAASPSPSAAAAATTITGATESTPYGDVQVSVSFSGKKITAVTVLQVPNSNNYDQRVAQSVPPILEQEILSSQSSAVNTVSGGTYTSDGYLQSVQSAIDKLP
ncbi:MAG: FMN-binding protein [Specibacter sp.]